MAGRGGVLNPSGLFIAHEKIARLERQVEILERNGMKFLEALGISGRKADFVYGILGMEEDEGRVASVHLDNLDTLTARVQLHYQFKDNASLRKYLERRGLDLEGASINKKGNYQLQHPSVGVTVYFNSFEKR